MRLNVFPPIFQVCTEAAEFSCNRAELQCHWGDSLWYHPKLGGVVRGDGPVSEDSGYHCFNIVQRHNITVIE
jgi:hypothetical protein